MSSVLSSLAALPSVPLKMPPTSRWWAMTATGSWAGKMFKWHAKPTQTRQRITLDGSGVYDLLLLILTTEPIGHAIDLQLSGSH